MTCFACRLVAEDRPYWWIQENRRALSGLPPLQQTPETCETGPGSPSGHAMVNYVIWFAIAHLLCGPRSRLGSGAATAGSVANRVVWNVFFWLQVLTFLSRTFIAAHFPHQCFLGSLIGSWSRFRPLSLSL